MRRVLISMFLFATGLSPVLAQQISQSPLIAYRAGAACTHGPYPSPTGADDFSGYGIAGCLPSGATPRGTRVPGGEVIAARQSAPPASTAPEAGLFSTLHNVER